MTKPANPWTLALLWINLAVAIVILIESTTGRFASLREVSRAVTYALVYANLTGLFGTLLMSDLVPRLAQRGHSLRFLVPVGIVAFTAIGGLLAQALLVPLGFTSSENFWPEYLNNLRAAMPLALMFGLGAYVHASLQARVAMMEQKLREQQLAEDRIRKLAMEARLRSLEARVHPHFLFNTLNSISALIPVNPEHAEQLVGRLAVLLRACLDSGRHPLIPLREELTMVASYLAIEKARFGDKLRCSVEEVQAGGQDHPVPPMAVQSLVENAVKHGIMVRGEGDIFVNVTPGEAGLRVEVRDTGPGFDLTAVPAGHGLDNLVERLQALFGDSAGLRVFRRDDQTVVELALPSR
jgi:two-component system sensor histidine kinase AlgZ